MLSVPVGPAVWVSGVLPAALAVQGARPGPVRVAVQPVRAQPVAAQAAQRGPLAVSVLRGLVPGQRWHPRLPGPETTYARNWRSAPNDRWHRSPYREQRSAWRRRGS